MLFLIHLFMYVIIYLYQHDLMGICYIKPRDSF